MMPKHCYESWWSPQESRYIWMNHPIFHQPPFHGRILATPPFGDETRSVLEGFRSQPKIHWYSLLVQVDGKTNPKPSWTGFEAGSSNQTLTGRLRKAFLSRATMTRIRLGLHHWWCHCGPSLVRTGFFVLACTDTCRWVWQTLKSKW